MLSVIHIANNIGGHDLSLLLKAIEAEQAALGTPIIADEM